MYSKDKSGFTLVMTLVLIAFLSIVSTALITLWKTSVIQNVQQEKSMQAYYLARSGAFSVANWIVDHQATMSTYIKNGTMESSPVKINGSAGTIRVTVMASKTKSGTQITVVSTGMVDGAQDTLQVKLVRGFDFNKAVITKKFSNDKVNGNITIIGGIEYQSIDDLDITGSASITGGMISEGQVDVSGNASVDYVTSNVSSSLMTRISMPDLSKLTVGSTLTVNSSEATITSVSTNNDYIRSVMGIKNKNDIAGAWFLATYVTKNATYQLLLSGTSASITLSGNPTYDLSVYAPLASVTLNGGFEINGSVIAKDITMDGGGNKINVNLKTAYVITSEFFKSYIILPGSWSY